MPPQLALLVRRERLPLRILQSFNSTVPLVVNQAQHLNLKAHVSYFLNNGITLSVHGFLRFCVRISHAPPFL